MNTKPSSVFPLHGEIIRLCDDFVVTATSRRLPTTDIEVCEWSSPEYTDSDMFPGCLLRSLIYWVDKGADFVNPQLKRTRAAAWPLCTLAVWRVESGVATHELVDWYVTANGELRRDGDTQIAPWPAEFYAALARAAVGPDPTEVLESYRGSRLVGAIFWAASLGKPETIVGPNSVVSLLDDSLDDGSRA